MPGSPAMVFPPGSPVSLAQVQQHIDTNTDRAASLERSLLGEIDQRIAGLTQQAKALADHLEGMIASRLNDSNAVASKLVGKLYKAIDQQLGNNYVYAFPLGYVYPTVEEANARLLQTQPGPIADMGGPATLPMVEPKPPGVPTPGKVPPSVGAGGVGGGVVPPTQPPGQPVPPVGPGGAGSIPPGPVMLPATSPTPPPFMPVPPSPPVLVPSPVTGDGGLPVSPAGGAGGNGYPNPSPLQLPGGNVGANGQCPSGYMSVSFQQSYTAPAPEGAHTVISGAGPHPLSPAPGKGGTCSPQINLGSFDTSPGPVLGQGGPTPYMRPWTDTGACPQFITCTTVQIDGCYFPPGFGSMMVAIPNGWTLCLRPSDGWVVAAQGECPAGFDVFDGQPNEPPGGPGVPGGPPPGCVPIPPGGQCMPLPIPQCGPDANGKPVALDLANDAVCKAIQDAIDKIKGQNADVADFLSMKWDTQKEETFWSGLLSGVPGKETPLLPVLLGRFARWLQARLSDAADAMKSDKATLLPIIINRAVFEFINKWTNAVPAQLLTALDQISNTAMQSRLPSGAQADEAYLADAIKQDEWECWHKAAGDHLVPATAVRDSKRERPPFAAAQKLFVRQFIDQKRYDDLARQAGVTDDTDKQNLADADNYFPSVAEIFHWQQEQLYNEDVIARFELDQDWDEVYAQYLKDRTDGHQMKESDARRHYMSIWKRPGYTEMVDATRRLRDGRVDADLVFSEDDLNTALKQEGYPDFWIKRLAKLREHVPTRRDVHSLYMNHVIDEEEVKKQWQDQGFAPDFADMQTAQLQIERQLLDYHRSGYPAPATLATHYARGELSKNEFEDLAQRVVFYDGQLDDMTNAAQVAEGIENKRLALTGVKGQFTSGLLDASGVHAALAAAGIDGDQIERLTQYWVHLKKSTPKQVGASTLCGWRKDQLIGPLEQYEALIRLGYNGTDADLIVKDCTYKIQQATEKALAAAQKAAEAAAAKAQKAQAAAAKAAAKAAKTTTPP